MMVDLPILWPKVEEIVKLILHQSLKSLSTLELHVHVVIMYEQVANSFPIFQLAAKLSLHSSHRPLLICSPSSTYSLFLIHRFPILNIHIPIYHTHYQQLIPHKPFVPWSCLWRFGQSELIQDRIQVSYFFLISLCVLCFCSFQDFLDLSCFISIIFVIILVFEYFIHFFYSVIYLFGLYVHYTLHFVCMDICLSFSAHYVFVIFIDYFVDMFWQVLL